MRIFPKINIFILSCLVIMHQTNAAAYAKIDSSPFEAHMRPFTKRTERVSSQEQDVALQSYSTALELIYGNSKRNIPEGLRLLHLAADCGEPSACGMMQAFCDDRKYGLKPEWSELYGYQSRYWPPVIVPDIPTSISAVAAAHDLAVKPTAEDTSRRPSGDSDGTGTASVDSTGSPASALRQRRTDTGSGLRP